MAEVVTTGRYITVPFSVRRLYCLMHTFRVHLYTNGVGVILFVYL